MKRKIIEIDEKKCTGCGICVNSCPEGAIQLIEGKARLVGELYCDGLGACLGDCPEGAITITEKDVAPYDEKKVMENIIPQGKEVILAHLKHLSDHQQDKDLQIAYEVLKENGVSVELRNNKGGGIHQGCPGMKMLNLKKEGKKENTVMGSLSSELGQWPIQLQLLNPHAPYFKEADLVVCADCVPFAYADFHRKFLKNKILIIFCPKLDSVMDQYLEKLTTIIRDNTIKSMTMVHMEVPCCSGVVRLVEEAVRQSGKNILLKDYTISLKGEII